VSNLFKPFLGIKDLFTPVPLSLYFGMAFSKPLWKSLYFSLLQRLPFALRPTFFSTERAAFSHECFSISKKAFLL
jgi:hypothetical protein